VEDVKTVFFTILKVLLQYNNQGYILFNFPGGVDKNSIFLLILVRQIFPPPWPPTRSGKKFGLLEGKYTPDNYNITYLPKQNNETSDYGDSYSITLYIR